MVKAKPTLGSDSSWAKLVKSELENNAAFAQLREAQSRVEQERLMEEARGPRQQSEKLRPITTSRQQGKTVATKSEFEKWRAEMQQWREDCARAEIESQLTPLPTKKPEPEKTDGPLYPPKRELDIP